MPGGYYPHGKLEVQGIGDLVSVTDISLDLDNKATVETTMHSAGAGFSHGPLTGDGSFSVKYGTAPEAKFMRMVIEKQIKGFTFKLPDGERIPMICAPGKGSYKSQETGADTIGISFVGFTPETQ
jgi:hypothetical protein